MNIVRHLREAAAGRDAGRLAMRWALMRADAFAFLRGSVTLWHARLPDDALLRKAPAAWACGDLHADNFGSVQAPHGVLTYDLNDFDDALLAPASGDLLRLMTSWLLLPDAAATKGRLSPDDARRLAGQALQAHTAALLEGHPRWLARETTEPPVRTLLDDRAGRDRAGLLAMRTDGEGTRRRLRLDGDHALPVPDHERDQVQQAMAAFAATQPEPGWWRLRDVARRVSGLGSLGLPRWVLLVDGGGGRQGQRLLDLKIARPPAGAARSPFAQPTWANEAERVVTLQRRLQAMPVSRLHALTLPDGRPVVLRALQPREDRLSLPALARGRGGLALLAEVAATQGRALAWAQLRGSGRQGAAPADDLAAAVQRPRWARTMPALAQAMAERTRKDWQRFAEAFDDGAFR